jgi:Predicted transcriptional regulator
MSARTSDTGQTERVVFDGVVPIVASYVSRNEISPDEVLSFVRSLSTELSGILLYGPGRAEAVNRSEIADAQAASSAGPGWADLPKEPAVPIEQSVREDAIVCLFDGEPRKMLHRYIRAKYNMSPERYRLYWNLPENYPMTAPGYKRRE